MADQIQLQNVDSPNQGSSDVVMETVPQGAPNSGGGAVGGPQPVDVQSEKDKEKADMIKRIEKMGGQVTLSEENMKDCASGSFKEQLILTKSQLRKVNDGSPGLMMETSATKKTDVAQKGQPQTQNPPVAGGPGMIKSPPAVGAAGMKQGASGGDVEMKDVQAKKSVKKTEEEKKKEEKKKAEEEKKKTEEAKKKAEEEKKKEEKKKAEETKKKAEEEKKKAVEEKKKAEEEKKKAEETKKKAEEEKKKEEKKKAEETKKKAEEVKKLEEEKKNLEAAKKKAEEEKNKAVGNKKKAAEEVTKGEAMAGKVESLEAINKQNKAGANQQTEDANKKPVDKTAGVEARDANTPDDLGGNAAHPQKEQGNGKKSIRMSLRGTLRGTKRKQPTTEDSGEAKKKAGEQVVNNGASKGDVQVGKPGVEVPVERSSNGQGKTATTKKEAAIGEVHGPTEGTPHGEEKAATVNVDVAGVHGPTEGSGNNVEMKEEESEGEFRMETENAGGELPDPAVGQEKVNLEENEPAEGMESTNQGEVVGESPLGDPQNVIVEGGEGATNENVGENKNDDQETGTIEGSSGLTTQGNKSTKKSIKSIKQSIRESIKRLTRRSKCSYWPKELTEFVESCGHMSYRELWLREGEIRSLIATLRDCFGKEEWSKQITDESIEGTRYPLTLLMYLMSIVMQHSKEGSEDYNHAKNSMEKMEKLYTLNVQEKNQAKKGLAPESLLKVLEQLVLLEEFDFGKIRDILKESDHVVEVKEILSKEIAEIESLLTEIGLLNNFAIEMLNRELGELSSELRKSQLNDKLNICNKIQQNIDMSRQTPVE